MRTLVLAAITPLLVAGCVPAMLAEPSDPNINLDPVYFFPDGTAIVAGSTDLPDGSWIDLQLVQWDAYDKELGTGDPRHHPHGPIRSVKVAGGRFDVMFNVTGWPSGDGAAIAMFGITSAQPPAVREHYGLKGERLKGPHVVTDSDGGRYIDVSRPAKLP